MPYTLVQLPHFFFLYRPSPVKLSPPPTPLKLSPLGEKVRGGQYHVRQKGGTISRTVGGWPFWCEEGRAKVVPATPLKLSPPALKLSVGAKYRFLGGGTISRGRVGKKATPSPEGFVFSIFFVHSTPVRSHSHSLTLSLFPPPF